jgi:F0F1-type ATP synthase assembly protein I
MAEKTKLAPLPHGEGLVWSVIGTLISGPVVWGGIGALLDRAMDSAPMYLALGLILGFVLSMYIVYVRYGRETSPVEKSGGSSEQR